MFENYLAAALRNLIRNRTHAAINLFGLALGFAAALLIALFVRDEYTYDRFFPGYRDVYLLTEIRDFTDHHLINERWDCSFPDLAAKLSVQFPQIATAARIMPLKSLAGDLQTALATPDSVVLTRTAARKYFGARDGDKSRCRSRRCDCCVGIIRAVSSFGRTAHQRGRHQEGHGCQLDRHSALDARRLQPAGPVGQRDRLAVRVLDDAALARGVCSSR
jgi:putative ABC transport system permease protein